MKKIISALILSAVIGAAFADVSINLNYRQRANLFTKGGGTGASAKTEILNTDTYAGSGTDNFQIRLKGDLAQFDMLLIGDEATTDTIRAKNLSASVFLGNLTLWAGFHSDGQLNGNYRVKTDVDAGSFEGYDFEYKKLGSAYANSPTYFVDNMVQNTDTEGENYAGIATYNLKFSSGSLKINGFYITNEGSDEARNPSESSSDTDHLEGHAGGILLDAKLDSLGSGEFVFKYGESITRFDAMALGLYVQPKFGSLPLVLTVGGALSIIDSTPTDWSVDLRARYQAIPKKLSFTTFHNISAFIDPEGVFEDGLYSSANPTKALAANSFATSGNGTASTMARDMIMTNNLMVRYVVNDWFAVTGIIADMIGMSTTGGADLKDPDGKDCTDPNIQLRFSGWFQFYAASRAFVNIGLVCSINDVADTYETRYCGFYVPVIFRVRM